MNPVGANQQQSKERVNEAMNLRANMHSARAAMNMRQAQQQPYEPLPKMQVTRMFPTAALTAFNMRAMHIPQVNTMRQESSSAPTNIGIEEYCNAAIHPVTGEHITNYMKLKKDPATTEQWSKAFGKEFGGLAQGDELTGEKGTNTVVVMTHEEIAKIKSRIFYRNMDAIDHMHISGVAVAKGYSRGYDVTVPPCPWPLLHPVY